MSHQIDEAFLALPMRALADAALTRAQELGVDHADFRLERILRSEQMSLRTVGWKAPTTGRTSASECGWSTRAPGDSRLLSS